MWYYLLANFFSALSETLCVYFASNGFIPVSREHVLQIFLHVNYINTVWFMILFFFLKSKNKINFSIKDTFLKKDELKQIILFSLPVLASCYKAFIMGHINMSNIVITSMVKPFIVWGLAVAFLNDKFKSSYIKYALLAIIGFFISNYVKMKFPNHIWFLISYALIAGCGDTTRRYYCRKRSEDMQAMFLECFIFAFYSTVIFLYTGEFSFKILFHPLVILISLIAFSHHMSLVHGVRTAASIATLEFVNFSKMVFTLLFSSILLNDTPNMYQLIGAGFIICAILGFNAEEEKLKKKK